MDEIEFAVLQALDDLIRSGKLQAVPDADGEITYKVPDARLLNQMPRGGLNEREWERVQTDQ